MEATERSRGTEIRWGEAFRAMRKLLQDNDDTTQVFKILEALRGDTWARNIARMRSTETGRRILDERRNMLAILSDRDRLRGLPEGSLGRVYLDFMEREGLTADGLAKASVEGYRERYADADARTLDEWGRDSHDLWHVVTGYGRDPLGEICLLGFSYSQVGHRGAAFMALLGMTTVYFEYPGAPSIRALVEGFRNGRAAEFMIPQDWEAWLREPIDEVRRALRIRTPSFYRQSLPFHDPSRSKSKAARERAASSRAAA